MHDAYNFVNRYDHKRSSPQSIIVRLSKLQDKEKPLNYTVEYQQFKGILLDHSKWIPNTHSSGKMSSVNIRQTQ